MTMETSAAPTAWQRFDRASFGLVYGTIVVLSVLMAIGDDTDAPLETAVVLFGSVLAITLAEAFAEVVSSALRTGDRITRHTLREAWRHSRATLFAANLPTILFLAAAFGLLSSAAAVTLSQLFCVALLAVLGARVGWVIEHTVGSAVLGGLFAGSIGLILAILKYAIH